MCEQKADPLEEIFNLIHDNGNIIEISTKIRALGNLQEHGIDSFWDLSRVLQISYNEAMAYCTDIDAPACVLSAHNMGQFTKMEQ